MLIKDFAKANFISVLLELESRLSVKIDKLCFYSDRVLVYGKSYTVDYSNQHWTNINYSIFNQDHLLIVGEMIYDDIDCIFTNYDVIDPKWITINKFDVMSI